MSVPLCCRSSAVWYVSRVAEAGTGKTTLAPLTPTTLNLTMVVPTAVALTLLNSSTGSTSSTPSAPTAGAASLASNVFVVCSRRVYQCAQPTVLVPAVNFSASSAVYQELLSCALPDTGMPASTNCEAVVQLPGLGFSGAVAGKSNAKITVGLVVNDGYPQPAAGSMAGGQAITINGKGALLF